MTDEKPYLSIVSPVYQAEGIVDELVKRITEEVTKITEEFEIVLVEDGSIDQSWENIERNCNLDQRVKGIKLTRNFGQVYAITAGLKKSSGKYVVVMDCDLQGNPNNIHKLLKAAEKGNEVILTKYNNVKHNAIKRLSSYFYYKLYNLLLSNSNLKSNTKYGTLSLITKNVVNEFSNFNDYHRHYISIIRWLGFPTSEIIIEHEERFQGESSYDYWKLFKLAINGIISQTDKLLKYSIYVGFFLATLGLFSIVGIIVLYFYYGFQSGWASLVVLNIFSTGVILISIGIAGLYISKIFEQTKYRPLFVIEKMRNF